MKKSMQTTNSLFPSFQESKTSTNSVDTKWIVQLKSSRSELAKTLNTLRQHPNKAFVHETYKDIVSSEAYTDVQQYKSIAQQTEDIQKDLCWETETSITLVSKIMWKYVSVLHKAWETKNKKEVKTIIDVMCKKGLFRIWDIFAANDRYENLPRDKQQKTFFELFDFMPIEQLYVLITEISELYPEIIETSWLKSQLKESIKTRMLQVKDNVAHKVYNNSTRRTHIRNKQLWYMITRIYSKDIEVLSDLDAIFRLLVEQGHQDWTNSGTFTYWVQAHINAYLLINIENINSVDNSIEIQKQWLNLIINNLHDLRKSDIGISLCDLDNILRERFLISWIQNKEVWSMYKVLLDKLIRDNIATLQSHPEWNIKEYSAFMKQYYNWTSYTLHNWEKAEWTGPISQLHTLYQEKLEADKQREELKKIAKQEALQKVNTIFSTLSAEDKDIYFKSACDESRGQNHHNGMHSFKEFPNGMWAVIVEHSYRSSRWWVERDSGLDIYTDNYSKKYSIGMQNYRDRFDQAKDNYGNQFSEILSVEKVGEFWVKIVAKMGNDKEKTYTLEMGMPYNISLKDIAKVWWLAEKDKKMITQVLGK